MLYVFKNEMPQLYQVFQKLSMDSDHTYQGGFFKANFSAVTIVPQRCVLLYLVISHCYLISLFGWLLL